MDTVTMPPLSGLIAQAMLMTLALTVADARIMEILGVKVWVAYVVSSTC